MTRPWRCAVLDDYQSVALQSADWGPLTQRLEIETFTSFIPRVQLAEMLWSFDIIVAMRERTRFDSEILSQLPSLKLLVTTGMANAAIDMDAARRQGITVAGAPGSVGPAAELAWGLLLAVMRNIPAESANLRDGGGRWQLTMGRDLMGKSLGVVGLGKLGSRVARYGRAFDMKVLGWSANNTRERSAALGIAYCETLHELLRQSDVVSLHLALNDETAGIIGEKEIAMMKPGAVIINTARGALVDEDALVDALAARRIAGAGLDVFATEPLPQDHPIRKLENVIATPHLGYVTQETYALYFAGVVEAIAAWLDARPIRVLNG